MRINTQSLWWSQMMGRQRGSGQLLTGSMKAAEAKKALQQQEFYQKVSALSENKAGETQTKQEKRKTIDEAAFSPFFIEEKDVPKTIAWEMDCYYQSAGNVVDNMTAAEERMKYMQAEYEKAVAAGKTEEADARKEWMEKEYQDMTWITGSGLNISHFRIDHADLYGKNFGAEADQWLGDLKGRVDQINEGLKGAGSVEEALQQLSAAKEQMMGLAEDVALRYQEYTGETLSAYEYQTAGDFQGIKWDAPLILNQHSLLEEGALPGREELGGLEAIDLSQYIGDASMIDRRV